MARLAFRVVKGSSNAVRIRKMGIYRGLFRTRSASGRLPPSRNLKASHSQALSCRRTAGVHFFFHGTQDTIFRNQDGWRRRAKAGRA